jgi:phasin family protein
MMTALFGGTLEEIKMINNFVDMQKLGKDNLEATVKSFGALSKSSQAIAAETAEYSKKSFEESTKALEKMFGAKTAEQAITIQTEFAKTAYESYVAQVRRIGELYTELANEAYKSFQSNVSKAAPVK